MDVEDYVDLRATMARAVKNMLPRYERREIPLMDRRVGYDDDILLVDTNSGRHLRTSVDCTMGGTFRGDSRRLDPSKIVVHRSIAMWSLEEMARRKLRTIIGPESRKAARDVYDAAWLVANHRQHIERDQMQGLGKWYRKIKERPMEWKEWKKPVRSRPGNQQGGVHNGHECD